MFERAQISLRVCLLISCSAFLGWLLDALGFFFTLHCLEFCTYATSVHMC